MSATSWRLTAVSTTNVRGVRVAFSDTLRKLGRNASEVDDSTIILGELLANACEHGRLPITVELRPCGKRWRLHVSDAGSTFVRKIFEYDPIGDRGRGFYIVEQLGGTIRIADAAKTTIEVTLPFGH